MAKITNTYIEGWGGSAYSRLSVSGLLESCCDPNTEVVQRIRSNPYKHWCARTDSNRQPSDPKSDALSIELRTLVHYILVVCCRSDYGRIS